MGRIKPTLVKRTAEKLIRELPAKFTLEFNNNKKIITSTMPSKKIRNKIAGYIARLKKRTK